MRLLVTGATGKLGGYLLHEAVLRHLDIMAWSGTSSCSLFGVQVEPVDFTQPNEIASAFERAKPEVIIHAAAISSPSECEKHPEKAQRINTDATAQLAELAAEGGARLVYVSTDLVFDGEKGNYNESDTPSPLSVYGRTKHAAEMQVLKHSQAAVARVNWLFGPTLTNHKGFFDRMLEALRKGCNLPLYKDERKSPLSLAVAAKALCSLAMKSEFNELIHLGGPEHLSRWDIGCRLATYLNVDSPPFQAVNRPVASNGETPPKDTSFNCTLWHSHFPQQSSPKFEDALWEMNVQLEEGNACGKGKGG
jgi:dTDP-4-dehydrorhamnose reductase